MDKFLRVNMDAKSLEYDDVKEEYKLLGGEGLKLPNYLTMKLTLNVTP